MKVRNPGKQNPLERLAAIIVKHGMPCYDHIGNLPLRPFLKDMLKWSEDRLKEESRKVIERTSSLSARERSVCLLLGRYMSLREAEAAAAVEEAGEAAADTKLEKEEVSDETEDS